MVYNCGVVEWAVNGYVTVIGYGSQEYIFCVYECNEKVKLYYIVGEGDIVVFRLKIKQ